MLSTVCGNVQVRFLCLPERGDEDHLPLVIIAGRVEEAERPIVAETAESDLGGAGTGNSGSTTAAGCVRVELG